MISPSDMPANKPESVAVFMDYENVRKSALGAFCDFGTASYKGMIDPVACARLIATKRNRPSTLSKVFVFRGRPNPERQPEASSDFDRYWSRWQRDTAFQGVNRSIKYRDQDDGTWIAQEKGIDVALVVKLIAAGIEGKYDAVVVFSSDTDLLPAVEYVLEETGTHIEIAAWAGNNCYPLFIRDGGRKRPYCHFLSEQDFSAVRQDGIFPAL